MPSTAVRFGPFDYPIIHVWRLNSATSAPSSSESAEFAGLKGTQDVSGARVWPYQYDTLSVGFRGAINLLNVTELPGYLLYQPREGEPRKTRRVSST
ncbi:hypothetical protein PF003_g2744 [Phytophthora fragariae]|nr:hypothetical protein PF003_g2744 [Phytophthora fragariae]